MEKPGRMLDESIYGVFAEAGRDDRRKKISLTSKTNKPVSFVKGQTLQPTSVSAKPAEDARAKAASDDEVDSRFVLDANAPNAQGIKQAVEGPKLPARNKLSFNQMANNYGKGFSMLQKMGFTGGGLGRHNDGIANPIEVQKRQGKMGLQDDGEMVDQDLYGNEGEAGRRSLEELLGTGTTQPKAKRERESVSDGWKRDGKPKKPKTVYKTADEVISEPAMRIVDMRGPEVKVASSFAELAASLSGDSVKSLKELRHNARLLVSRYEDKVRAGMERKRHCESVLLSVAKETDRVQAAAKINETELAGCKKLVTEIESLRERQDQGTLSLHELADAFNHLRSEKPKEFRVLEAADVAFALALPTARREFATWQPLKQPVSDRMERLKAIAKWQDMASEKTQERFTALIEASLLPCLRKALVAWSPREPDRCIRLMESCRAVLQSDCADSLIAEVVLPRLRSEIEGWDPRLDTVSPHLWLHPWLPLLGSQMDILWAPIRFKISSCLERWDCSDSSAHGFLQPWWRVFDPCNWDPLIEKVLSKIEKAIAETPVQPDGQNLQALRSLFSWMDLAPLDNVSRVLESAFFPQWHAALRRWLRDAQCDFSEVLQWYQGWKSLFPKELLEQARVQKHFASGLEVMKHTMTHGTSDLPDSPERGEKNNQPSARLPADEISLSLSDYMSQVAAEEGLIFLPKKQQRNGKQVYQLGTATIQLDKNLVYVAPTSGEGEWKAASMDEVLALARATSRRKK
ncbi:STIPL1 [Symbiodinium necroappetens]|uniref:STIPL1 protein n=1 Tax=Symbiodinium necroappetens TaxID=1628268 RepID=A0A813B4W0_9DINO|nr:STIPL1 [Symbiodinium necroappetens]